VTGLATRTARHLAERVLRRIGATSTNQPAASPGDLDETLYWMGMVLGAKAGTSRLWWLVPTPVQFALPITAPPYDLSDTMAAAAPTNGFMFAVAARLTDSTGNEAPIELLPRWKYMQIENKAATGRPEAAYIDHTTADENLWVYPVPAITGYSLILDCQVYPEDPHPTAPTPAQLGNVPVSLAQEFYLWLTLATAYEVGSGPVRALPMDERRQLQEDAERLWMKLLSWRNEHKTDEPRRTRAWGR
jgi:hypothetical protein